MTASELVLVINDPLVSVSYRSSHVLEVFKAGALSGLKKEVEDQAGTGLGIGQKLLEGKELCLFLGLSLTQNRESPGCIPTVEDSRRPCRLTRISAYTAHHR